MSLRKSPTMTPVRLEANRRNAQKSTGPRTARGKAQSRMNSLRTGARSCFYRNLWLTLLDAPPCAVDRTARAFLAPEMAFHSLFAESVEMFRQAEMDVVEQFRCSREQAERRKKNSFFDERSLNVIENKAQRKIAPIISQKTKGLAILQYLV
jgi:hypothetical protein